MISCTLIVYTHPVKYGRLNTTSNIVHVNPRDLMTPGRFNYPLQCGHNFLNVRVDDIFEWDLRPNLLTTRSTVKSEVLINSKNPMLQAFMLTTSPLRDNPVKK